jgi:hypothetical protein
MATAIPFEQVFQTTAGVPVSGVKVYVYAPTTTTPRTAYSDTGLSVPVANPFIGDAAGYVAFYLSSELGYRIVAKSADDSITYYDQEMPTASAELFDATTAAIAALTVADGDIIQATGVDTFRARKFEVATYSALKAIGSSARYDDLMVYVGGRSADDDGGQGLFRFVAGDQSASVTADPREAIWVAPTDASTGASGAWKRVFDSTQWLPLKWWNPTADATWNTDGGTDDFLALYYAINSGYKIDGQGLVCAFVSRAFTQQTAASPTAPTAVNGLRCTQSTLYLRNLSLVIRTPHYWGCRGLIGNDFTATPYIENVRVSYPGNGYISVVDVENSNTPDLGASNYTNTACMWLEAADTDSEITVTGCEVTGSFIGTGIRVINFQRKVTVTDNRVHDIDYDFITAGDLDPANDRINGISIEQCNNVLSTRNIVSRLGGYYHAGGTDYTSQRYNIGMAFGDCEDVECRANNVEYCYQAYDFTGSAQNRNIHFHHNRSYRCEVWTAKFANDSAYIDCHDNYSEECLQGIVVSGPDSAHGKIHDNTLVAVGDFTSGRAVEAGFTITGTVEYGITTITGVWLSTHTNNYHPWGISVYDNTIIGDAGGNMAYGIQDSTTADAAQQDLPNRVWGNVITNAATADYKGSMSRDVSVGLSANQAISANTDTTVLFDSGEFDPSASYTAGTGIYLAKWGMYVEVEASIGIDNTAVATPIARLTLHKDTGSGYAAINGTQDRNAMNATDNIILQIAWSGWLNAGDALKVVAYQNNGSAGALNIKPNPMTYLRIREKPGVPDAANWTA